MNPNVNNSNNNINNNNLNANEPMILGELKKEKSSKPLFVFIVFALVLGTCFGLPYLEKYLNKEEEGYYFNENFTTTTTTTPQIDDGLTILKKDTVLSVDNKLFLENITINNDTISYKITAKSAENLDLAFYYLEIYDNTKTLLGKNKLTGYVGTASNNKNEKLAFNANSSDYYLKLINLEEENLPDLTQELLTCTLNNNTYSYTFANNALTIIKHTYINNNQSDLNNYVSDLNKNKGKSDLIKTYEGSESEIIEGEGNFTFNATLDLNHIKITDLGEYIDSNYYNYGTLSKLINYDMTAKGYDCK